MMDSVSSLLFVVLIGVTCIVQTMAQDCPYYVWGCLCSQNVACHKPEEIPPLNTGASMTKMIGLYFERGNITSISRSSLPPGLTEIELVGSSLTNISDDAFDTSAATLQTVYIKRTKLRNLPKAFKKLTNLTQLTIIDTPIQDWDTATLKQIGSTLHHLTLRNVSLSLWPTWISDFRLLRTLGLSFNPLRFIPDNAFIAAKDSLTKLDLSGTGLTHVPKALSTLSNVTILSLGSNNFTDVSEFQYITESTFAEKMSHLLVHSAGLTRMPDFSNLTNLETVNLNHNRISDIPPGSLPVSLIGLYFSNNSLSFVPKDVANMSKLSTLDLTYNRISQIEPNSLPSGLTYLGLDFNYLTTITNTTFKNLRVLRDLGLRYNPISTISSGAFSDLVSLDSLYILDSHLREIPLAVTRLNPNTQLYLTTTEPLSCTCPAPHQLVQWAAGYSFTDSFPDYCDNGQSVREYLSGQC